MSEFMLASVWLALAASIVGALSYAGSVFAPAVAPEGARRIPSRALATGTRSRGRRSLVALGDGACVLGAALLVVVLVVRWQMAGRPPWTNAWEFTVAFACAVQLGFLALSYVQRVAPVIGSPVQAFVALLLLSALLFFSPVVEPLVPALQSEGILGLHVGFMVASYGALTLSFFAATLRLAQGDARRFGVLPSAVHLDRVAHASVVLGFPLLTAGVLLGAYWANDAWGRYWAWDPKETSSLVTWLIYGAYLHVSGLRGWTGRRAGLLLAGGYLAVLFTYFGVNFWIAGLHSYA